MYKALSHETSTNVKKYFHISKIMSSVFDVFIVSNNLICVSKGLLCLLIFFVVVVAFLFFVCL